jgi:maltose-binding protein MalE
MEKHPMKKAKRGLLFTISLVVLVSFLLTACGPAATTEPPAPTQATTEGSPATQAPTATAEPKPLPAITILINESPWLAGFEALVNKYVEETGNQVNLNRTAFIGMLEKSRNAVQASESEFEHSHLE